MSKMALLVGRNNNWSYLNIASCFELQNGINFSAEQKGRGTLVVDVLNMFSDNLYVRTDKLYRVDVKVSEERLLRPGDILFVRSSVKETGVGWPALFPGHDEPVTNCGFLIRARPIRNDIDSNFLVHYLRQHHVRSQMIASSGKVAITNINQDRLGAIAVPLPPLPEQKRIAAILDQAEALRAKRRAALAKLDSLVQSIFLEMFGDPGKNNLNWPLKSVSDYVSEFQGGKSVDSDSDENVVSEYRVLKVSAATSMIYRPDESKPVPIDYTPPQWHFVKQGDLLFSRANTSELVGAVAYVNATPPNLLLPDKLWRFIWRNPEQIEALFIWHLFQTEAVRREISKRATGTSGSMKNISQEKVFGIRTILPPIAEQTKFAHRIAAVEALKQSHRDSLIKLDTLFASLQHRAFRGEL
jgi:type I restriction enzyme, S subunit